mgnify:CR=1 FL=1
MKARIAIPDNRVRAIDRLSDGQWRVWLATPDFVHGTYLLLYPNGCVERVVVRQDEGDEVFLVKGAD